MRLAPCDTPGKSAVNGRPNSAFSLVHDTEPVAARQREAAHQRKGADERVAAQDEGRRAFGCFGFFFRFGTSRSTSDKVSGWRNWLAVGGLANPFEYLSYRIIAVRSSAAQIAGIVCFLQVAA
jgi:hypothetical protein